MADRCCESQKEGVWLCAARAPLEVPLRQGDRLLLMIRMQAMRWASTTSLLTRRRH